jgi:hypothetical protein
LQDARERASRISGAEKQSRLLDRQLDPESRNSVFDSVENKRQHVVMVIDHEESSLGSKAVVMC